MNEAIKLAIEKGGYQAGVHQRRNEQPEVKTKLYIAQQYDIAVNDILTDPLFWQALGKALGWRHAESKNDIQQFNGDWVWHWHDYVDVLANGGYTEKFWSGILQPRQ